VAEQRPPAPAGSIGPEERSADPLAEVQLDTRLAYKGVFFEVIHDSVRCPDGHVGVREFIRHPGAVMIVPLLDPDTLVLERQFRYPLGRSVIEMPAGKLDPGEAVLDCARRELREETGYEAASWLRLGAFHNAIGYSDEKIEVYLARDLTFVGAGADAGEVLEVFTAPWRQLLDWIDAGSVTDVKTIIGAHWLERYLSGRFTADPAPAARA
jgi:ADP-ribose pyrophosphatase